MKLWELPDKDIQKLVEKVSKDLTKLISQECKRRTLQVLRTSDIDIDGLDDDDMFTINFPVSFNLGFLKLKRD